MRGVEVERQSSAVSCIPWLAITIKVMLYVDAFACRGPAQSLLFDYPTRALMACAGGLGLGTWSGPDSGRFALGRTTWPSFSQLWPSVGGRASARKSIGHTPRTIPRLGPDHFTALLPGRTSTRLACCGPDPGQTILLRFADWAAYFGQNEDFTL